MQQIKKKKANAGETLVEVVASIFIFLILMGVLEGAIAYSSNSLKENKKIRSDNAKIIEALQNTEAVENAGSTDISFIAYDANTLTKGNEVFSVPTKLKKKDVTYTDSDGTGGAYTCKRKKRNNSCGDDGDLVPYQYHDGDGGECIKRSIQNICPDSERAVCTVDP